MVFKMPVLGIYWYIFGQCDVLIATMTSEAIRVWAKLEKLKNQRSSKYIDSWDKFG